MASNGLLKRAKKGKCRMCLRVRDTDMHVKPVGEVHHGFATGHVWECKDVQDCEVAISKKLQDHPPGSIIHENIKCAVKIGRY